MTKTLYEISKPNRFITHRVGNTLFPVTAREFRYILCTSKTNDKISAAPLLSRPTKTQHTHISNILYIASTICNIYIYIYIYCVFVGLDNKLYKMQGRGGAVG